MATRTETTKIRRGDVVVSRQLRTIHGASVDVPQPQALVHLQFRRFAGCPVCNIHLRSFTRRYAEIVSAGVCEVVVFHSSVETMLQFQDDLPYAVIADPEKHLYREFGVETSKAALLKGSAPAAVLRGASGALIPAIRRHRLRGYLGVGDDHLGLPADFLIASDGSVLASKYGVHANDQWPLDEMLSMARQSGR